ncbi:MAG: hypothetical protein JETT_3882 [Candidatus Jettenia ecosi]|uniref:Uncharacterized protein n=1 Tax=Candidatus Jettenia ecosi TaxID=2494326 RepID=A0A533QH19_9BACT|nr:MAG: hypothetical protein JETT_3882 [Candidatus Jettenia ecosi]
MLPPESTFKNASLPISWVAEEGKDKVNHEVREERSTKYTKKKGCRDARFCVSLLILHG